MPIVTVQIIEDAGPAPWPADVAQRLADELGTLFGSPLGGTWVKVELLPRDRYAENGVAVSALVRPVFVEVLKANLPAGDELAREAKRIAEIVCHGLARPLQNTHVVFAADSRGRVAFGGQLI